MKSKIKNIIITFLLLICCTFTLVGCTNTNNTIMDIARQNGLNCIKSSKDYNSSNNNTNTAPSTTINIFCYATVTFITFDVIIIACYSIR